MMVMPQRKQQKKRGQMPNALKKGDKVITIGGIHGEITKIDGDDISCGWATRLNSRCCGALFPG